MARLECAQETADGVTLVEVHLASDVRERVTLEPTHEGPCWPPRRHGVPETGWSAEGWTGVVPADEPRALGYATPADPADPPVRIADSEPAPDESEPATPRDVLRALGDPRPPRDAVEPGVETSAGTEETAATIDETPAATGETMAWTEETPTTTGETASDAVESTERGQSPGAVDRWRADLDAIAARVERAEALATVGSVGEAQDAVAAAGGIDAVRDLVAQLDRDRERLASIQERAATLAERTAVDVPLEDLARLV